MGRHSSFCLVSIQRTDIFHGVRMDPKQPIQFHPQQNIQYQTSPPPKMGQLYRPLKKIVRQYLRFHAVKNSKRLNRSKLPKTIKPNPQRQKYRRMQLHLRLPSLKRYLRSNSLLPHSQPTIHAALQLRSPGIKIVNNINK